MELTTIDCMSKTFAKLNQASKPTTTKPKIKNLPHYYVLQKVSQ
jgi:hypothetical protein